MSDWLPGAKVYDLHPGIGNGPFSDCYGVILHVNVDHAGTPDSFWGNGNPGQVCPNFQVYKDGSIHQMLPLDWQPWCQRDGNFNYAAIETAGYPDEPLTDAQIASCAKILRAYHETFGVPLRAANAPGERGLGTHKMGGAGWGGHECPGDIRTKQRAQIVALAGTASPSTTTTEDDMALSDADIQRIAEAVWKRQILNPNTGKKGSAESRLIEAQVKAREAAANTAPTAEQKPATPHPKPGK